MGFREVSMGHRTTSSLSTPQANIRYAQMCAWLEYVYGDPLNRREP